MKKKKKKKASLSSQGPPPDVRKARMLLFFPLAPAFLESVAQLKSDCCDFTKGKFLGMKRSGVNWNEMINSPFVFRHSHLIIAKCF